jgi:hypothetical protein
MSYSIPTETLKALRALREAAPKISESLMPAPPPDKSGLILENAIADDWYGLPIPGSQRVTPTSLHLFLDTDPMYWKPIAVFDENGGITSLLLGRQRLQTVHANLLLPLLDNVVKLDLAGAHFPVPALIKVFGHCQTLGRLTHVYLGGNALGDEGFIRLVPHLPKSLQMLDLRYNDLGSPSAAALAALLPYSVCEKVYLEGNSIGDTGAMELASHLGPVRELYLGHNKIGPEGAKALAVGLLAPSASSDNNCRLELLYLEGNHIGSVGAISFQRALETLAGADNKKRIILQKLYVENNGIGKEEAMSLGSALQSSTMIGDPGFP